ncbi:MAG: NUDIX hydrolase, partial [Isosphaeraceae bacterium]
ADGTYADREVVVHRGAVALVPMVGPDRVCLIKNDRYSVGETLIEVPAGTIDPGGTPEETAARELAEETGYRASRITRITDWWVSPGVLTEKMTLYLCEDLTEGPADHQPDERLENLVVPWDEALAMVHDGRIRDAKTIVALTLCDSLRRAKRVAKPRSDHSHEYMD